LVKSPVEKRAGTFLNVVGAGALNVLKHGKEAQPEPAMEITERHEIQKDILRRLGYHGIKKFSELRGDTPSNKLAFHLNRLQEKGLVDKQGDGYSLTESKETISVESPDPPLGFVLDTKASSGMLVTSPAR